MEKTPLDQLLELREKTLGELVDDYIAVRAVRLHLDKESKRIGVEEEQAKQKVMAAYKKQGVTTGDGKLGVVNYHKKDKPRIKDRIAFNQYVKDNDAFDLFQARVHEEAWEVRRQADGDIPGVETYEYESLSVGGPK